MIRIKAKPTAGFWRCGVHHPAEAVEHDDGRFTADELAALEAEPQLVVERTDTKPAKAADVAAAIAAAADLETVDRLAADDERATVVKAAEKRRVELSAG